MEVNKVQIEGIVLLKIIKHCEDEPVLENDCISGILLGLAVGSTLEITNCFPIPQSLGDDERTNQYELALIGNLRQIKSDYLTVGFYQSSNDGSFVNRLNLEAIHQYQHGMPESILLTYEPSLTARGQLGLRAYRLSPDVFEAMSDLEKKVRIYSTPKGVEAAWECDYAAATLRTNFTRLLDEVPVEVHNSPLVNVMLHDIVNMNDKVTVPKALLTSGVNAKYKNETGLEARSSSNCEINTAASMEQQLKSLLAGLELIHDSQYNYQRKLMNLGKSGSLEARNRDLAPTRLDIALVSAQMNHYCTNLSQMAGQTVGKLMITQAVQPNKSKFAFANQNE